MKIFAPKFLKRSTRGQTFLEYAMLLVVVMLPLAAAVRTILGPVENSNAGLSGGANKPKNGMQKIVLDSYGNEKRMGVIGRPYP